MVSKSREEMKRPDWISFCATIGLILTVCYAGQMKQGASVKSDDQKWHDSTLASIDADTSVLSRAWNSYGRSPGTMYCGKSKNGQYWCDTCPRWKKYDTFIMRK